MNFTSHPRDMHLGNPINWVTRYAAYLTLAVLACPVLARAQSDMIATVPYAVQTKISRQ